MIPVLKTLFKERFVISEQRLDHCRKCEHFIHTTGQCRKCGCFMDYKTLLASSECPIGKWGKYTGLNKVVEPPKE